MSLVIYNTLTRKKQEFIPTNKDEVKMYVCGPTVYNYISVGNARPIIVFNMVRNYLEFLGYKVKFVQNITDIEDKIIKKANEEGVHFSVITERYTKAFLEDLKNLEINNFYFMPKASEMIPDIILVIEKIIQNGFAYVAGGDVYFDVSKFKNYGKLSGQDINEMLSSEEESFSKRNKVDFTLWKSAKPGEPSWDSPWGKGRPGWHIECSAMSIKYLDYGLDIHGGGIDLVFPHHENEIAQSEAAFPEKGDFVRYWMHNGMIEVKEEKMSKSKGLKEEWILRNLLNKYSPNIIKMYILSTHYRSPLEFSIEKLEEAKKAIEKLLNFLRNLIFLIKSVKKDSSTQSNYSNSNSSSSYSSNSNYNSNSNVDILIEDKEFYENLSDDDKKIFLYIKQFKQEFKKSMDDDFNSARAIGELFNFIKKLNTIIQSPDFNINLIKTESLVIVYDIFINYTKVFSFNLEKELKLFEISGKKDISKDKIKDIGKDLGKWLDDAEIKELIKQRDLARKQKNFKKADEIRNKLSSYGIILEDRKEGTIWKRELVNQ